MLKQRDLLMMNDEQYAKTLLRWWGVWLDQVSSRPPGGSLVSGIYHSSGASSVRAAPVACRDPYAERVAAIMDWLREKDEWTRQYMALVYAYEKGLEVKPASNEMKVSEKTFKGYKREGVVIVAVELSKTRHRGLCKVLDIEKKMLTRVPAIL